MHPMKKRLISMVTLGGAAAAALAVTAGPAEAAGQPPQCEADVGAACVAVTDGTRGAVRSIGVNGKCVSFTTISSASITNRYFPQLTVNSSGPSPTTLTYSGSYCESGSQNSQPVGWFTGPSAGNYRWVLIGRVWA
jgi:hypothetical protein